MNIILNTDVQTENNKYVKGDTYNVTDKEEIEKIAKFIDIFLMEKKHFCTVCDRTSHDPCVLKLYRNE